MKIDSLEMLIESLFITVQSAAVERAEEKVRSDELPERVLASVCIDWLALSCQFLVTMRYTRLVLM
jgi:hypothetical protein